MDEPVGKELLRDMIEAIGRSASNLPDIPLTGFLAMKGEAYCGELMWVGRAVNGWTEKSWRPSELGRPENVDEFVELIAASAVEPSSAAQPNPCPLRWVTERWGIKIDYNTKKSAFWRVAKKTLLPTDEIDQFWSSRLVWSNLYKIAPAVGGNPNGGLRDVQFPFCRDLLIKEIELFTPRRLGPVFS
jgi:hypothetical protein